MKLKPINLSARLSLATAMAALAIHSAIAQPVLYSDNFATDTSANWLTYSNSTDFKARFGFRYGTNSFVRGTTTNTIPLAPSSTPGTETNGLKISVNDVSAAVTAVNFYPVGQSFSNNYALKFDVWMNYTGTGLGNGTGGTEDTMFGINHVGDKNVFNATGSTLSSPVGDGVDFAMTTDGDYSRDYQVFVGDNVNPLAEYQGFGGGFLDRDLDGNPEFETSAALITTSPLRIMFPSPTYESFGMPSKQWARVEIRQRTNDVGAHVVTWLIEGYVIAEHTLADAVGQTNGNIMIGMMDPFASIGTPTNDSFAIYDNVRVVDLNNYPTNEIVSIIATDNTAAEPSGDDGLVTISRTGSTASALSVPFRTAGTATRGTDYVTQTNGVTFTGTNVVIPAGLSSIDITVHVLDDSIGEAPETVGIGLVGNPNAYDIREAVEGIVTINDDGDKPSASISAFRPGAYEGNTNSYGQFNVIFSTPFNTDVTVNYTIGGTAVNGTDYETIPASIVLPANTLTNTIYILAKQNSDTVSNRTVTLQLAPGTGYTNGVANTNATVIIYNDDLPPAVATLYSDAFDVDSSANWNVNVFTNAGTNNCDATFAFDYSSVGIPPAPHSSGTTLGLKLRANSPILGGGLFCAVTVSPKNQNFTNDFRLRFDMWLNYPGSFPVGGTGSTQLGLSGISSGNRTAWPGGALSPLDTIYLAVSGDGGTSPDVRIYTNGGAVLPAGSGVYSAGTQASAVNTEDAYYSMFGRLQAPPAQVASFTSQTGFTPQGVFGMVWHDVVVNKLGSTLTWTIDGVSIAAVNASKLGFTLSTNIFVGQSDINTGQTTVILDSMLFGLVDNLVVESLPAPVVPAITNIAIISNNVRVQFTGSTNDIPPVFLLMSSTNVAGPYLNVNAAITNFSPGAFQATTPYTTNAARFYRILR